MSGSGNSSGVIGNQNDNTSKREQKKFQQLLKVIEATQNHQQKSHKRRKQNNQNKKDPQARKVVKVILPLFQTESQNDQTLMKDVESSARQVSQQEPEVEKVSIKRQIKNLHDFYNTKYGIPEEKTSFQQYLLNYSYEHKSMLAQKQCEDWTQLETISGKKIQTTQDSQTQSMNRKLNEQLLKGPVKTPFSKGFKEFIKTFKRLNVTK